MSETSNYKVQKYTDDIKNIFKGVYNDFILKAYDEYKFELEPLSYEDFTLSVNEGLIDCLVLLEDDIPTAFMVYTTEISESIELNMIHCIGSENLNYKRRLLMDKFVELNASVLKEKVVTYPMLGKQADFAQEITHYGFRLVGLAVERFQFGNPKSVALFKNFKPMNLPKNYQIIQWDNKYYNDIVKIINKAFTDTSDAMFDPRFTSIKGSEDILNKITTNVYGTFLPECCSVLLHNDKPVGICLTNITAGKIANIPLIGITKEHCGKGFGKELLYNSLKALIDKHLSHLSEVNASTETDNYPALKMYRKIGFKEDYYYPQAYKPIDN